jgi:Rv0078B-related antitoxin
MSPAAALDAQIARYREMTPEQRVLTALRLHELACEMARMGIRRQHPEANADEVEHFLHERLELARAS